MARAISERLDEAALRRLLASLGDAAQQHRFDVAPNPCVGAALLAGTEVVARGFHEVWGGPHAEVRVLDLAARAGSAAPDTLVVTLEPCSSHGKTPPCVDRILASGVRHIVVGALDPDPRHGGQGLERLREAGLEVVLLPGASSVEAVAPYFADWTGRERLRRPRPWTIAKWAQTQSGMLVPPAGVAEGRWISGPEALAEVQVLRSRVDAIVTGVGTVLADDPRLTVRSVPGSVTPPARVVLDSYLRTPPDARLFAPPGAEELAGEVHVLCQAGADGARFRALEAAGARVTGLHSNAEDHLSLRDVLTWLWQQGMRRVLLEAGPTLLERTFELGFVDQLRVYTGSVRGGRGKSLAHRLATQDLSQRLDRECGGDSVLEAFPRRRRA